MSKRRIRRALARLFLAATGWKPEGDPPGPRRYVLIAAPHTTNWDFPYLLAFAEHFGMRISWLGKASLFRGPLGPIMRALGGIPIERSRSENRVAAMAKIFEEHDDLGLVVPAEATRGRTEFWKSGFYYIALTARVPIVMSFLDYTRKRGGIGPAFLPTGNVSRDMDAVRAFYADKQGKFPEAFGPVRLREESERSEASAPDGST
ncbi:MAG: 1-acyl-sn-glycerol-3-phosphate acyltransferase [Deltaproteobacteria bacterium]|nr:1-acyl-sn-glycerol-3-phosphate acyltransferase [Deltaproteobacteria bacterium]